MVDGSNEIAGDGLTAHKCIGEARRTPVHHGKRQGDVALEVLQNHGPEVSEWILNDLVTLNACP